MTKYNFKFCMIFDVEMKNSDDIYLELIVYFQIYIQELYKFDDFTKSWKSNNVYQIPFQVFFCFFRYIMFDCQISTYNIQQHNRKMTQGADFLFILCWTT